MEENPVPVAEPPVLHTSSLSDLVNPVLVGIFIVVNFTGRFGQSIIISSYFTANRYRDSQSGT